MQRLLSPTGRGQSLRRVFRGRPSRILRVFCGEDCWIERLPSAKHSACCCIDRCANAARYRLWDRRGTSAILLSRRYPAAQQSRFVLIGRLFICTGIRDNFMTGKVIMPDEEYLQSWWYGVPLGTSETHSDRMECTACHRGVLVVALRHRREGFVRAGTAGARSSASLP